MVCELLRAGPLPLFCFLVPSTQVHIHTHTALLGKEKERETDRRADEDDYQDSLLCFQGMFCIIHNYILKPNENSIKMRYKVSLCSVNES